MAAYEIFSHVYDTFMEDVPYDAWCRQLHRKMLQYGIDSGLVLDLGCGTGQMTRRFRDLGYDMIGADRSADMLEIAMEQEYRNPSQGIQENPAAAGRILYLNQDMRAFELYGTVRAVISVCDCMNYVTDPKDLLQVFRLVNNYLDPGGIVLFDMNTPYKYRQIIGNATIAENREHESFIWENHFDPAAGINQYDVTFFIEEEEGWYRRYEEQHIQRAYETAEVEALLTRAGLAVREVLDAEGLKPVTAETQRILYLAQEQQK